MSSIENIHCNYPVDHKDDFKDLVLEEKEFDEQMEYFIRYILNDNSDKLTSFDVN